MRSPQPPEKKCLDQIHTRHYTSMESDLIRGAREFWGNRNGREISNEEAREIIANVTGFFSILQEWENRMEE